MPPPAQPHAGRAGHVVTIGIPTYNRPAGLERAAHSALAQDYPRLEVLISDNASPDPEVSRVGTRLSSGDSRVRYVRQAHNAGHAANYQWLLEQARGKYFMWLADDDWIDPQYVSRCVAALEDDPASVLVCGLGSYYREGSKLLEERPINLTSRRPGARLISYFARVSLNGPMFGVAAREDFRAIGFPPVVGGDWQLVAALAGRGTVRTLGGVQIHRSLGGLGSDASRLTGDFGMRGLAANQHHALVAARMWKEIAHSGPSFRAMGPIARGFTATLSAALILGRFTLADLLRHGLGPTRAVALEGRISTWLRARG
ncbi:MAG: glycosyltransferase family 2 protein [Solirubrobacteraceae bacterium]